MPIKNVPLSVNCSSVCPEKQPSASFMETVVWCSLVQLIQLMFHVTAAIELDLYCKVSTNLLIQCRRPVSVPLNARHCRPLTAQDSNESCLYSYLQIFFLWEKDTGPERFSVLKAC